MRIGAQRRERRAVPEHPRGRDAVQVERHHERHLRVDRSPAPARGSLLPGRARPRPAWRRAARSRQRSHLRPPPAVPREVRPTAAQSCRRRAVRHCRRRTIDRHDLDVAALLEDAERAAEIGAGATPRRQERRAAMHLKIGVAARHRIERGDLLLAFDDQNPMHAGPLRCCLFIAQAARRGKRIAHACTAARSAPNFGDRWPGAAAHHLQAGDER